MNSLTLLLYGINVLQNISVFINVGIVITGITLALLASINHIMIGSNNEYTRKENKTSHTVAFKVYRPYLILFVALGIVNTFVPSERTIYLMAASEVGQRVVQSEKVSGIFDPTIDTLKNFVMLENEKIKAELNKLSEKKK